jgi:hypothetical protein
VKELLVFALGLIGLAVVIFAPFVWASERGVVERKNGVGVGAIEEALRQKQLEEGRKVRAEMDLAGLWEIEKENAGMLEEAREKVGRAMRIRRGE